MGAAGVGFLKLSNPIYRGYRGAAPLQPTLHRDSLDTAWRLLCEMGKKKPGIRGDPGIHDSNGKWLFH